MSLRVLHIAYPFAPVGPRACGGAEQVLTDLDRALTLAGHHSVVVACEGSESTGQLYAAPIPQGQLDGTDSDRRFWQSRYQQAIDRALATGRFDLIHMHGLDWHQYHLPSDIPTLVTLHMPVAWYPTSVWDRRGRNLHFQCVSQHQRLTCPDPAAAVVANGVELPALDSRPRVRNFAVALGRICPEKNLHEALEAGTRAGTRVLVGGQTFTYSTHLQYEREQFRPALSGNGQFRGEHRFLGPLQPHRKQRLLAAARCLLHPTLAPETSSLVTMEALAAGTPVIAYRSGALPEIIEDGVTGFLVRDVAEMADAIGRVGEIDRNACRIAAEQRFSRDRMTAEYLDLYARILQHGTAARQRCA